MGSDKINTSDVYISKDATSLYDSVVSGIADEDIFHILHIFSQIFKSFIYFHRSSHTFISMCKLVCIPVDSVDESI